MAIIYDKRPAAASPAPALFWEQIGYEDIPLDKASLGSTSIRNKEGGIDLLEFRGYIEKHSDSVQKIHIWGKIADKTAAYAEVLVRQMEFTVDYEPFRTAFKIAPEFRHRGIGSQLLQVICELALDFQRIAGKEELVVHGQVVGVINQEVIIWGKPQHYYRWYSLGARVTNMLDHQKIEEELQKPKENRNWYLRIPSRGQIPVRIPQDRLQERLTQRPLICGESCWKKLFIYDVSVINKQKM